jgi:predicted PolB exonuclease-like 3'-5' exonuclease
MLILLKKFVNIMTVLVFDIETIPDIASGKKLYKLDGLNDQEVVDALSALRRSKVGNTFLPHYLQKIIAISLVISNHNTLRVWSLGDESATEEELIQRFFNGVDKYKPTLVSWNGSGFDLPTLHYRALYHGIAAPTYWENGDSEQGFRYNNYLNRFHYRHLDLMDVLAGYQNKAFAPLDEIASMLGFPGKMGMDGSKVWQAYHAGEIASIRNYCETDVLNTYCVYLRFELMRGVLDLNQYQKEIERLKSYLAEEEKSHLTEFLNRM